DVTLASLLILKHCAERRRDGHREFERHAIVCQALHHSQQRDVRFGDRLKQPLFLEEILMFQMAYKWKMGVENEGEMAGHWLTLEERRTRGQGGSASPKTMLFWQRVEGNAVHLQRP